MVYTGKLKFENDVKVNGIQTLEGLCALDRGFENDVKVNGIQTFYPGFE